VPLLHTVCKPLQIYIYAELHSANKIVIRQDVCVTTALRYAKQTHEFNGVAHYEGTKQSKYANTVRGGKMTQAPLSLLSMY